MIFSFHLLSTCSIPSISIEINVILPLDDAITWHWFTFPRTCDLSSVCLIFPRFYHAHSIWLRTFFKTFRNPILCSFPNNPEGRLANNPPHLARCTCNYQISGSSKQWAKDGFVSNIKEYMLARNFWQFIPSHHQMVVNRSSNYSCSPASHSIHWSAPLTRFPGKDKPGSEGVLKCFLHLHRPWSCGWPKPPKNAFPVSPPCSAMNRLGPSRGAHAKGN